jgi:hypothetical protein
MLSAQWQCSARLKFYHTTWREPYNLETQNTMAKENKTAVTVVCKTLVQYALGRSTGEWIKRCGHASTETGN